MYYIYIICIIYILCFYYLLFYLCAKNCKIQKNNKGGKATIKQFLIIAGVILFIVLFGSLAFTWMGYIASALKWVWGAIEQMCEWLAKTTNFFHWNGMLGAFTIGGGFYS